MKALILLIAMASTANAGVPKIFRSCSSAFGGTKFDLLTDGSTQYVNFKHGKDAFYLPLKTFRRTTGGGSYYSEGSGYAFVFKWSWVHDQYGTDRSKPTPYDYEYTTLKGERVKKEIKCRDL